MADPCTTYDIFDGSPPPTFRLVVDLLPGPVHRDVRPLGPGALRFDLVRGSSPVAEPGPLGS